MKQLVVLLTIIFSFNVQSIVAQTLLDYKKLIDLDLLEGIRFLEKHEYKLIEESEIDGCQTYKFEKDKQLFIYNFCKEDYGDEVMFTIIGGELSNFTSLLNEANQDKKLSQVIEAISASTAFLFTDAEDKELFFVFDHRRELYQFSGSNINRYEFVKEMIEEKETNATSIDPVIFWRELFYHTNLQGETIEEALAEFKFASKLDIVQLDSAAAQIISMKDSGAYTKMKELVKNQFISERSYRDKVKSTLAKIENISDTNFIENKEEVYMKIAIENDYVMTLIMLNFIFDEVYKQ